MKYVFFSDRNVFSIFFIEELFTLCKTHHYVSEYIHMLNTVFKLGLCC